MTDKKNDNTKPIYVVAGKDAFLVCQQVNELINSILTPEQMQMALLQVQADKITAVEIFDELRTLPFLADRRVVVLDDADKFVSENREVLEKYFEQPAKTGVLILVVKTWRPNTRLAKMLPKTGKLLAVAELKAKGLINFVQNYAAEKQDKNLSYNTAQMLVELAGNEPGILCCEIDKLATFIGQNKTITEKHIAQIVGKNRTFGVFEVTAAMTEGNLSQALEKLRLMFATDKNAEYTSVGAFAWHFRRMFNAKAMLEDGQSEQAAAKKLRIWNSGDFFRMLRKMPLEKIGDCLRQLAEMDYEIKTGRATAKVAIEAMIVKLANR